MQNRQQGFTLIELIVVIVILGILAATALPKFVDLGKDARTAVLDGIQGAATSASVMAYGKAAAGGVDLTAAANATTPPAVTINGSSVLLQYGYPIATAIGGLLQDTGKATFAAGVWTIQTNCTLTYVNAASAGASPTFTRDATGC